ncbi:MAG: hypothetical protein HXY34_11290 [Candidatus Thorarchaeota archaeon]|nr:hypothetical protein [Candidatus Thorarchaeota archaeon]
MAVEFDSSAPEATSADQFKLSAVQVVTKTIDVWAKKPVHYIVLYGIGSFVSAIVSVLLLYIVAGNDFLSVFQLQASSDITTTIANLFAQVPATLAIAVSLLALALISTLLSALFAGSTMRYTLSRYAGNNEETIASSISFGVNRIVKLFGVQLLLILIAGVIMIPGQVYTYAVMESIPLDPYLITPEQAMSVLTASLFMLLLLLINLYLNIRFSVALPVAVVEDCSIVGCVKRAWSLSSGQFWHIFGPLLLLGIGTGIIGAGLLAGFAYPIMVSPLFVIARVVAVQAIVGSLNAVFLLVLYKDLEVRKAEVAQLQW